MFVVGEWEGALENFRLEEKEEPFDLKFFLFFIFWWVPSQKIHARQDSFYLFFFQPKSLRGNFYLRKLSLSRSQKNKLKLLTFDNVSLAPAFSLKPVRRSRMKTAIDFSRQNDAGALARITESLVFVVVPVLESKGL